MMNRTENIHETEYILNSYLKDLCQRVKMKNYME